MIAQHVAGQQQTKYRMTRAAKSRTPRKAIPATTNRAEVSQAEESKCDLIKTSYVPTIIAQQTEMRRVSSAISDRMCRLPSNEGSSTRASSLLALIYRHVRQHRVTTFPHDETARPRFLQPYVVIQQDKMILWPPQAV